MQVFCCQNHLEKLDRMSEQNVLDACESIRLMWPDGFEIHGRSDGDSFVSCFISSRVPAQTWSRIRQLFIDSDYPGKELSRASIITATGSHGWDNYLLLHHYEQSEEIDTLDGP